MWILRLNMTDRSYKLEELPEKYKHLAGRGLTSTIVHDEVPPTCHPLGPNNKLVFSPGVTTGTSSPTSARISAGAKSPLTGTIKQIDALTRRYRVIYSYGKPDAQGNYVVDHSAGVYIFGRSGRIHLLGSDTNPPAAFVHDLKQLIADEG